LQAYRQYFYPVGLLLTRDQLRQGLLELEFPQLQLDLHLPGASDAEQERMGWILA
jgi:hypothetical protein